jgi:zinc transporter 1/2/3
MIALSTHAVFEGIAVGLVKDLPDLWTYVIAIFLHKWAAAMSLGISMSKNFKDETTTMYILLLIFSFATPLGISIGMAVSSSSVLINIIFSSLAAGTFVYIACSEVIVEEFSTPEYKWIKYLAFLLGATLIACLTLIES